MIHPFTHLWDYCRAIRTWVWRMRLGKLPSSPSIFSMNCVGAMVAHDLGLQFRSPMVNLWMYPSDYIYAIQHPEFFTKPVESIPQDIQAKYNYPVGQIDGRYIYFMHYHSFEEAKQKWESRCKRIDWNNAYFILIDREGCTQADFEAFDALPYKNKVALTHLPHPEIHSAHYVHGFENQDGLGTMVDPNGLWGTRDYDIFDWVKWLKNNSICNVETNHALGKAGNPQIRTTRLI